MNTKIQHLEEILRGYGRLAVALSGGLDSSILLAFAVSVLGKENCLAVTAVTPYMMREEIGSAAELTKRLGVESIRVSLEIPDAIRENPPERCYLCKKGLFTQLLETIRGHGFAHLLDGTNKDDDADYRPGHKALRELGIQSPLREAGLGKDDIRALGRQLRLDDELVDKPAYACLLTRMEHGATVTEDMLVRIDRAEQYLRDLGFRACRVRTHGDVARIEIPKNDWAKILEASLVEKVTDHFKSLGFEFVSLDLQGYRQGSMNRRKNNEEA